MKSQRASLKKRPCFTRGGLGQACASLLPLALSSGAHKGRSRVSLLINNRRSSSPYAARGESLISRVGLTADTADAQGSALHRRLGQSLWWGVDFQAIIGGVSNALSV